MASKQQPTLPDASHDDASSDDALLTTIDASSIAPPADVDATLTDEHPGRYQLERDLGEGGIGRVYVALDTHLGRHVALKELLGDKSEQHDGTIVEGSRSPIELRFVNEARITGQLEHPGIVPVYELGRRADNTLYYAMRLVKGRTLEEALEGQLLAGRIALLHHFVDLCNTMAYAHARGVIHRDLKPDNVMVGDYGETVVLDWGLAKRRGEKDIQSSALRAELDRLMDAAALTTVAGLPIGTPAFMSPEQALGELDLVDERSDVYSLGVILYQLLSGRLPFDGDSGRAVIRKLLSDDPPPVERIEQDCPRELIAITRRAMQKDHELRYADAGALARDVQAFMTGELVGAHRYSPRALAVRWFMQHRRRILAAVTVVAVAAGAWWYRGVEGEREQARVEQLHKNDVAARVLAIFNQVASGDLDSRWLEVHALEVIALRDPVSEEVVVERLIEGLSHSSADVRSLAARSLSAFSDQPRVVEALVARLPEDEREVALVQIEVINALGVLGDPRAEDAVRAARRRSGEYSDLWSQTELAYRMIPLPPVDGAIDAEGWNTRGLGLMWKSRFGEAEQAFDNAIEAAPGDPHAYNNRAIVRRRLGNLGGALADYDAVIARDPHMVSAYNNRALVARTVGDYAAALRDLDHVVADGSLGVAALRNRSLVKRYMGDFDGAHADLEAAIALAPDDTRTHAAIGSTWIWTRDWAQALAALDQAIALSDSYDYALVQRARVRWVLGQRDDARADIDRVLRLDPADSWARRVHAAIMMTEGRHEEAKRDVDHCLENACIRTDESRRPLRLVQRAVVYFAALGHYHDALNDVDAAFASKPRLADAFTYALVGLAIAVRTGEPSEVQRWMGRVTDGDAPSQWYHPLQRLLAGEGDAPALDARFIDPAERCALGLALGLAAEQAGDVEGALKGYRKAAEAGHPHELPCLLADQATRALGEQ